MNLRPICRPDLPCHVQSFSSFLWSSHWDCVHVFVSTLPSPVPGTDLHRNAGKNNNKRSLLVQLADNEMAWNRSSQSFATLKSGSLQSKTQPQPRTSDLFTILIYSWVSIMFLQTCPPPYGFPGSPLLPTDTLHDSKVQLRGAEHWWPEAKGC